jgi:hypothetical protein
MLIPCLYRTAELHYDGLRVRQCLILVMSGQPMSPPFLVSRAVLRKAQISGYAFWQLIRDSHQDNDNHSEKQGTTQCYDNHGKK